MKNGVLIIDDEDIILQTLKAIYTREGIEARTECNPVKAIESYQEHGENVVLVDVLMPEMDGADVVREIKKINPLCNVVVMTAFSNMDRVIECIEAGAVDYITKPFTDIGLLLDITRTTMGRVARWAKSFGLPLS